MGPKNAPETEPTEASRLEDDPLEIVYRQIMEAFLKKKEEERRKKG